jgi:hypothetical protein
MQKCGHSVKLWQAMSMADMAWCVYDKCTCLVGLKKMSSKIDEQLVLSSVQKQIRYLWISSYIWLVTEKCYLLYRPGWAPLHVYPQSELLLSWLRTDWVQWPDVALIHCYCVRDPSGHWCPLHMNRAKERKETLWEKAQLSPSSCADDWVKWTLQLLSSGMWRHVIW